MHTYVIHIYIYFFQSDFWLKSDYLEFSSPHEGLDALVNIEVIRARLLYVALHCTICIQCKRQRLAVSHHVGYTQYIVGFHRVWRGKMENGKNKSQEVQSPNK